MPVITLLTDFGQADSYVAEMKAALVSVLTDVQLIDVSHEVPPGNVAAAQYLLERCWRRFPPGTIHLVVVDPGVGTSRRAIAVEREGHRFVGPDNGVLTPVLEGADVIRLDAPANASPTFHGRDVFAPAAARLARGVPLRDLGTELRDPVLNPLPQPRRDGPVAIGVVIYVDRFGTLITNLPAAWGEGARAIRIGSTSAPLMRTFGDVAPGALVAFVGSGGTIEISVRDGAAAARLGAGFGTRVSVTL